MTDNPTPDICRLSPAELIVERSRAFGRADFGFIFDSCHTESNFRAQFTDRDEYIQFGWANLGKEFKILRCDVLHEDCGDDESRVIFFLEMMVHGESQCYAELAWLVREENAWRYHRGQKMEAERLPADLKELGFADFEALSPQIIF
jgi:uncharacterized protein YchJ